MTNRRGSAIVWFGIVVLASFAVLALLSVVHPAYAAETASAPWHTILWELIQESWWAIIISAAATYAIFGVYGHFKPVQRVVLPGEDENREGLSIVAWFFKYTLKHLRAEGPTDDQKADLGVAPHVLMFIAITFLGACMRGAARIVAVAIVFGVMFSGISPLM